MADAPGYDPAAFRQFERDGWESSAQAFAETAAPFTAKVNSELLEALAVSRGTRLLDVGCGPGMLVAAAAERGAVAVGADFSARMVAEARRLYPALEIREGDAEALPYEAGSFDAVACSFGLLHFAEPERAIAEAFRVLAPGGRYAITCWLPPEQNPFFGLIGNAIREHGTLELDLPASPPMYRFADPDRCSQALGAAGFVEVHSRTLPLVRQVSDGGRIVDGAARSTTRTKAVLARQTPEALARIRAAVAAAAEAYRKGDHIELPMPALLTVGRKP